MLSSLICHCVLRIKCIDNEWWCVWQVETIEDSVQEKLVQIQKGIADEVDEKEKNELKKRKLLAEV